MYGFVFFAISAILGLLVFFFFSQKESGKEVWQCDTIFVVAKAVILKGVKVSLEMYYKVLFFFCRALFYSSDLTFQFNRWHKFMN